MVRLSRTKSLALFTILTVGGLTTIVVEGSLATRATPPDEVSVRRPLSAPAAAAAVDVIRQNPELRNLADSNPYTIASLSPYSNAGVDTGGVAAEIVFGGPIQFEGSWPTMYVDNSVTEEEVAKGIRPPDSLSIRYSAATFSATATRLSVLVLDGKLVQIQPEPMPAERHITSDKPVAVPVTVLQGKGA